MYFKFDYGSKVKKFFSILVEFIGILSYLVFIEFGFFGLFLYISQFDSEDSLIFEIILVVFSVANLLIVIRFVFAFFLIKKGVFIKDDCIVIKRRCPDIYPIGFNCKIDIDDILTCEKIYYKKPLMHDGKYYGTFFFNAENVVKITTYRHEYYPSIENADLFVSEIKKRQAMCNN